VLLDFASLAERGGVSLAYFEQGNNVVDARKSGEKPRNRYPHLYPAGYATADPVRMDKSRLRPIQEERDRLYTGLVRRTAKPGDAATTMATKGSRFKQP
jgi:hypothetical protein